MKKGSNMNTKLLNKIPFIEKRALVSEACLMYKRFKLLNKKSDGVFVDVSDVARLNTSATFKSVSTFEIVLGLLNRDHYEIITNEFMNREIVPEEWYQKKYSRSTFYRLKHEAVDAFLSLLFA